VQQCRWVAHFSHKLLKLHWNYTVMEKEILSIIATLEEFWGMLRGADSCFYWP
jgi:hypothetical protein